MTIRMTLLMFSISLSFVCHFSAHAQIPLTDNATVVFATADEARRILTSRDDFVQRMSPFDRAARMKTDQAVSEAQYLAFVGQNVLDWSDAEREKLTAVLAAIGPRLAEFKLPLPATIHLVRTTGREEGGAFYTRGAAIMFPTRQLASGDAELRRIVCHELFHVLSRAQPELKEALYATIGFEQCGEVEWPAELADRRITNPDAPVNDHAIELQIAGKQQWAIPIIYSKSPQYDVRRRGEFFQYLEFRFLAVERDAAGVATRIYEDGKPVLAEPADVAGFYEQIGRNTEYIIHPEEVLADNFSLLVLGETNVKTPEVLRKMETALREHAADGPAPGN